MSTTARSPIGRWVVALSGLAALAAGGCNDGSDTAPTTAATTTVATVATTTSTTQATTTTMATTTTEAQPIHISAAFTGEILIHSHIWREAQKYAGGTGYDFAPMFTDVQPFLSAADLAICHLEVPIAPDGQEPSTFPLYGAPKELAAAIKYAGFDRCSTASNHAWDQKAAGIEATLKAFDEQGLTQAGMARTPAEIEPRVIEVNGVKIVHLSYTWSYNGLTLPAGEEWRSALNDPVRIIADATKARELGAQIVIVSMHWGSEMVHGITNIQTEQADAITKSGVVDLIVGHSAHVIQPIQQVNGVWTVFGMGNVLSSLPTSDRWPPESQDGEIVSVDFTVNPDGTVVVGTPSVRPTWVDQDNGYVIKDVLNELARTDLTDRRRRTYEISLERTAEYVGDFIVPH